MTDLDYLLHRLGVANACAERAGSCEARIAHLGLVHLYTQSIVDERARIAAL